MINTNYFHRRGVLISSLPMSSIEMPSYVVLILSAAFPHIDCTLIFHQEGIYNGKTNYDRVQWFFII